MEQQKKNFKVVSDKKTRVILPNMFTLIGVCIGLSSIKFAFDEKFTLSLYLSKNNEIGIFLKKIHHGKGIGSKALKLLIVKHPRKRYLANINPNNISTGKWTPRYILLYEKTITQQIRK